MSKLERLSQLFSQGNYRQTESFQENDEVDLLTQFLIDPSEETFDPRIEDEVESYDLELGLVTLRNREEVEEGYEKQDRDEYFFENEEDL